MDNFLKQMAQLRTDFRDVQQKIDAKVDHMLEMLASMQLQLQMQGMTKGEEIGDDFSFADPQLHNLPCLLLRRLQKTEGDSEILPPNQQRSPSSHDSCAAQLESEGFVGVLNNTPITTTMAKSRFGEPKSKVLADLKLDEPNSVFEILPKQPLVVYLCSAFIESSKNNDARKVFGELTMSELNPLQAITVFVDLGKVIYIYMEENIVKNESTDATLNVCFEMKDIESIMNFDPGGDSKVFDSFKKLFYIEELVLLQNWSNSPRSVSLSFCFIFGKLMHTHMEISRRFVTVFVGSEWVESYARLLNINGVAMVFDDNSPWIATLFGIMDVPECKNDVVCLKNSGFCGIAIPHHEHVKLVGKKHPETYENFGKVHDILSCSFDDIPLNDMDLFLEVLDVFKACGTEMVDVIFFNVTQSDQARIFVLNASYFLKAKGHFVVSIKANYIDSIVLAESVFAAEVKKLQVEHFKLIEMVTLEPFEQYHVCDWIKMFDWLLSKLPFQFRYMSREDTTHSRGKNCCGNGRNRSRDEEEWAEGLIFSC